jgi:hypothetical protein
MGDREHGDKCMKQASRTTATVAVAAGTGVLTGGAGTVATVAATTGASTAAGVGMDVLTTGVDSAVHKEFRPAGVVEGVAKAYETGDVNDIADAAIQIGGEVAVGLAAHGLGKVVGKSTGKVMDEAGRKGRAYNSNMRSPADVKSYTELEKAVGKTGAKQLVDLARHIEQGKYDKQRPITASSVKTDTETHIGVNQRAKENVRVVEFKNKLQQVNDEFSTCTDATRKRELHQKLKNLAPRRFKYLKKCKAKVCTGTVCIQTDAASS